MIAAAQERTRGRFTLDGSEALEKFLQSCCERVRRELCNLIPAAKLEGLLLAGGYGRGEGGVLDGDRPYNDLDFYVFLSGNHILNARSWTPHLPHLGERLSKEVGLEVELKADSLARWRRSPVTMFSYDVVMGHKWILGDESLFSGCEHHRRADRIPPAEAARLMLNRCSGLLFAAELLERKEFTAEWADFVTRNIAKTQLGIGDACLTMFGQYHWSCIERHERLKELDLPWAADLQRHHAAGVEFKRHPKLSIESQLELARAHQEVSALALKVWLWIESRRLQAQFDSALDYAEHAADKCPETPRTRNALVNLKTFGRVSLRYPRERLFRALPLLLWEREHLPVPLLQRLLRTRASDFTRLVHAYKAIWQKFN
jgi:hypothetical protein